MKIIKLLYKNKDLEKLNRKRVNGKISQKDWNFKETTLVVLL